MDVAAEQSKNIFAILFKERYLSLNITQNNKFINRRIRLLKQWAKSHLRTKINEVREKISSMKEPKTPKDIIEALIID